MSSADGHLYAIDSKGYLRWKFKTKDLIESSPVIAEDGTIIVGSGDNKLYAVNSDGTLKWTFTAADAVRSSPDIVEVSPKFLSEDFRNSIIQKMEYTLLDMVEKRGPMAQTEMPAAVLEKLEKKLTTGVGERNGSKGGPVRAALNTVLIFRRNASCQNCVTPLNFITYLLISPGSAPVKGSWKTLTVSLLKPLTVKSLSVTRTLLRL